MMVSILKEKLKSFLSENQIFRIKIILNRIKRIRNRIQLRSNYRYDSNRFRNASSAIRGADDSERLFAHITMDYHRLEKGMALPEPRPGFGEDVVKRLASNTKKYEREYGISELTKISRNVLSVYRDFNLKNEVRMPFLDSFLGSQDYSSLESVTTGGFYDCSADELFPIHTDHAQQFLLSRRSVRQFNSVLLPKPLIEQAVLIAQKAPSVCNRQGARVYACNDKEKMAQILSYQNGNRGFGHCCGAVFIITVDMRVFTSLGERNQAWVDGGIFAMALVQGLHALEVGACMLNWSVEPKQDRRMRHDLGIDENQAVITMVGAGYVNEKIRIAASPRRELDDVIRWLR